MSRLTASAIGVVMILVAGGCTPAPAPAKAPDTSADVAAINALAAREIAAFVAVDTAGLDAVFAQDAIVMPPGEAALQGRAAAKAWAQALGDQYTLGGEYTGSDVIVSGDWAVHRFTGRLSMTPKAGGETISEAVKGVHVLQRQPNGSWVITQDVWNTDQPPPAAPGK